MSEPLSDDPSQHDSVVVDPGYMPRRRPDVLELDMGDGFVLYNGDATLVHHLNPSAALVWRLCDGGATVAQLSREIAEEYRLEVARITGEVAGMIAELEALGLVDDARE